MWTVRKVILYLSIAGLIGALMIYFSTRISGELWPKIVETLGLALIVSCIVGIIMELYLREQMKLQMTRMMREVSTDVFKKSLGHDFPECIWQQVTSHLLLNQFIRKDLTIDCNVTKLEGGTEDFIKMHINKKNMLFFGVLSALTGLFYYYYTHNTKGGGAWIVKIYDDKTVVNRKLIMN